jgi:hypothetical protein
MAVFTPKLQTFFKNCNLVVKNTVFPWFKCGFFCVKSSLVLTSGQFGDQISLSTIDALIFRKYYFKNKGVGTTNSMFLPYFALINY